LSNNAQTMHNAVSKIYVDCKWDSKPWLNFGQKRTIMREQGVGKVETFSVEMHIYKHACLSAFHIFSSKLKFFPWNPWRVRTQEEKNLWLYLGSGDIGASTNRETAGDALREFHICLNRNCSISEINCLYVTEHCLTAHLHQFAIGWCTEEPFTVGALDYRVLWYL
jgi:hypothetical protein